MAKKSEVPSYLKDIIKEHGNVVIRGNEILEQQKDYKTVTISPAIDSALNGGIREGSWLILSGPPKCGKAQPLSSLVYTPTGPKLMGEIEIDDVVCTPRGGTAKVKNIYPQGLKPIYKFIFSDKSIARCDYDHLWSVYKRGGPKAEIKTATDLFLDKRFIDRSKWEVTPAVELYFESQEVPIDPYLFGQLLINKTNKSLDIEDKELKDLLKTSYKRRYIPDVYKYNSIEVRTKFIEGVINGRSYSGKKYRVNCKSSQLRQNLVEVCRSIGIHAYQYSTIGVDIVAICPEMNPAKRIVDIVEDNQDNCQCIELDNEEGLYITDGVTVTHNTTTAMQLAYNCQKEGRPVIYVNSEGRLNQLNFEVKDLDPEKMMIVTAEDQPLSAETFLDITHQLITSPENSGALCIIDSISSLIPAKELENDVTGSTRPGLPKILSNFTKKCGQIVPRNKTIMCLITHMITNTSGFGKTMNPDGGVKIQFQSDTRMEVKSITPWAQTNGSKIGQAVNWNIYWSGLGAKSYECQSWIRYGYGIDKVQEVIILAQELGLISKAGAWYTCNFLLDNKQVLSELFPDTDLDKLDMDEIVKLCKFQGVEKLYEFINSNNVLIDILSKEVLGLL